MHRISVFRLDPAPFDYHVTVVVVEPFGGMFWCGAPEREPRVGEAGGFALRVLLLVAEPESMTRRRTENFRSRAERGRRNVPPIHRLRRCTDRTCGRCPGGGLLVVAVKPFNVCEAGLLTRPHTHQKPPHEGADNCGRADCERPIEDGLPQRRGVMVVVMSVTTSACVVVVRGVLGRLADVRLRSFLRLFLRLLSLLVARLDHAQYPEENEHSQENSDHDKNVRA